MSRNISIKKGLDWVTVLIYLILVIMGWLSIYGASYDFDQSSIFDFSHRAGKQFVWILTAFGLAGVIMLIDYKIYNSIIIDFLYIVVILLLIATIFLAPDIKGSHSWLVFGPISFQPAELAKVMTALALARYINGRGKILTLQNYAVMFGLVLLPMAIIVLQNETGSALVFVAFFLMFYREGMNGIILLLGVLAIILFILIVRFGGVPLLGTENALGIILSLGLILLVQMVYNYLYQRTKKESLILLGGVAVIAGAAFLLKQWININFIYLALAVVVLSCVYWFVVDIINHSRKFRMIILFTVASAVFCFTADYIFDTILQPHQQSRIKIVLGMEDDPTGAGYNVIQSKIAIGSGGFLGKGFLNGTQTKLKYVPEQDTDFIFCTVGEEFGFVGSSLVLLLFMTLLLRLIHIAERQRERFTRVYAYSIACILFFHILVNIGMVLGLMPVIGIPLPFFSYGGSSLWSFTIMLFILLRMDASRTERLG